MSSRSVSSFANLPASFLSALGLAAGFMAFTAWDQSYWWRNKADYSFGWLVPLFVAYVVHERWPRILVAARNPGSVTNVSAPWFARFLSPVAVVAVVVGSVLFLFGAFYRAAAGVTHLSSLAITAGMAGTILAAIYFLAPTTPEAGQTRVVQRWSTASLFLFPVLVWLVSAPLLSSVDNQLALYLMQRVTGIVFFVFDLLGLPIEQHGNVLSLPSGSVGVEEACSGVRSLTGCLFAGAFLAAVFVKSFPRKLLMMGAALVFAFLANLLRSLFLTAWAYYHGAASIEGTIHDLSGYFVLGIAVVAMLCVLPIVDRQRPARPAVPGVGPM